MTITVLTAIVAFILGMVGYMLVSQQRMGALQRDLSAREKESQMLNSSLGRMREELESARADKAAAEQKMAAAVERQQIETKQANEKIELLLNARKELTDAFNAMAAEALNRNNDSFLQLARVALDASQQQARTELEKQKTAVDNLVKPIADTLKSLNDQTQQMEVSRSRSFGELNERLANLDGAQKSLSDETTRLVQALRSSNVAGNWGEMQLRNVVELTGMSKHCDFAEQRTVSEGDKNWRPDMVVHLPGGRAIIVDAKATTAAYFEAVSTTIEATRKTKLAEHARNVEQRMRELGQKSYFKSIQGSPEFVVMFLTEAAFSAAVAQNPDLIRQGAERRVVLASPTTLIALLLAVAHGWSQSELAANAQRVSELGKLLYERLCVFSGHMRKLGSGLKGSVENYNRMIGSMESMVFPAARKFPELGVSGKTKIDEMEPIEETTRNLQAADWGEEPEPPIVKPNAVAAVKTALTATPALPTAAPVKSASAPKHQA